MSQGQDRTQIVDYTTRKIGQRIGGKNGRVAMKCPICGRVGVRNAMASTGASVVDHVGEYHYAKGLKITEYCHIPSNAPYDRSPDYETQEAS